MGGQSGQLTTQVLADQLTLSQPEETDRAPQTTACPPSFSQLLTPLVSKCVWTNTHVISVFPLFKKSDSKSVRKMYVVQQNDIGNKEQTKNDVISKSAPLVLFSIKYIGPTQGSFNYTSFQDSPSNIYSFFSHFLTYQL